MFAAVLYGLSDNGFGSTLRLELGNCNFEEVEFDSVAVVVIEDMVTSIRRYIFCISDKASITANEVARFYKATTFSGSNGKKSWTQVISHIDSEIFNVSTEHMIEILKMLNSECAHSNPFWKINNMLNEYVKQHNIECLRGCLRGRRK